MSFEFPKPEQIEDFRRWKQKTEDLTFELITKLSSGSSSTYYICLNLSHNLRSSRSCGLAPGITPIYRNFDYHFFPHNELFFQ